MVIEIIREPKYPPIEDNNLVCYLILKVGIPSKISPARTRRHLETMTFARKTAKVLGIHITSLGVKWGDSIMSYYYLFHFEDYERNDKKAGLFGETFLQAMSFISGPFLDEYESATFRLPMHLVKGKNYIEGDKLVQLEESRFGDDRVFAYPLSALNGASMVIPWRYTYAWEIVPILIQNERLQRAVRYMCISQNHFYVYPGQVYDVLDNPRDTARTDSERNSLEIALHNAFRAVEAVIGDPPKDDRRLYTKITAIGLDPEELVGYLQKLPLAQVVRNMSEARDKKSAHGSTPASEITIGEMLEYSSCGHMFVTTAIENELRKLKKSYKRP